VTPPAGTTTADLLGSDLIRYQYSTFPLTDDGATPRR
jgi:hypothetical protein